MSRMGGSFDTQEKKQGKNDEAHDEQHVEAVDIGDEGGLPFDHAAHCGLAGRSIQVHRAGRSSHDVDVVRRRVLRQLRADDACIVDLQGPDDGDARLEPTLRISV